MFWFLRVVVALTYSLEMEFMILPLNINMEIALLFVTLIALILVIRKSMIGALIYLITYGLYFGVDLYQALTSGIIEPASVFVSSVAMLLAFLVFLDAAFSKDVKDGTTGASKKTGWFYGTDKYEREKEEWEDKNQY